MKDQILYHERLKTISWKTKNYTEQSLYFNWGSQFLVWVQVFNTWRDDTVISHSWTMANVTLTLQSIIVHALPQPNRKMIIVVPFCGQNSEHIYAFVG